MKRNPLSKMSLAMSLVLVLGIMLVGCGNAQGTTGDGSNASPIDSPPPTIEPEQAAPVAGGSSPADKVDLVVEPDDVATAPADLAVRFGDDGEPFALHIYDNSTAAAIAQYVGAADWRLPINHFDDYDDWEVMQYYDIPSSYEIPSNPETVTSVKAGELYYSDPNRIVLFYGDGEISGDYTKVGYFDYSEEFRAAVENNPVLEGWGNKIVNISGGE